MQMYLLAKTLKENTHYKPILFGLSGGGSLEELLKKQKIEYHILNFNQGKFHKKNRHKLLELFKIARIFRKHSLDIIISRTYYPNVVGSLAAFIAGIKQRYWFQVSVEWKLRNSKAEKISARIANRYIANSQDSASYIVNTYNVKPEKINILANMVFERKIENNANYWYDKLNINKDDLVISLLSNFFPVKDHQTAIRAMAVLSKKYPNLKMLFAGYAPEEYNLHKIKALAYDLGLHKQLIFTESTHDVQGLLAITNICLFTSIIQHTEGSPNIILDYMFAKKPIVASNIGPIQELFSDLDNSYLYKPENAHDLVSKLELLINNSELRTKLGEANYQNVITNIVMPTI